MNIVSSTSNTTNFTIQWINFNTLKCVTPSTLNVSLFSCKPPAYTQFDYVSCLQTTIIAFQNSTCGNFTTTVNTITSK